MATILVTGASGFLGRYAVDALLAAGWRVAVTGRKAPQLEGAHLSVAADLLQREETKNMLQRVRPDFLLHLAWFDDPRSRWHSADNLSWSAATLNLVADFASVGGKRMVFGSSCAVYDFIARPIHSETDELKPGSLYGAAKGATANLLLAAQNALGISVAEARIFFCYGFGEPVGRLLPDLISGISRGESVPCSDGVQQRDYLHASDVAQALEILASSDVTGPVNVASGKSIPVADLITETAKQMGRPDLPQPGAIARSESDPANICANVSRLQELGFRQKHNLQSGVAETLLRSSITR